MLMAISAGSFPPTGRPTGQTIFSNTSAPRPSSRSSRSNTALFDALPITPMKGISGKRLSTSRKTGRSLAWPWVIEITNDRAFSNSTPSSQDSTRWSFTFGSSGNFSSQSVRVSNTSIRQDKVARTGTSAWDT